MNRIALKMLVGDRAKCFGIIMGLTFASRVRPGTKAEASVRGNPELKTALHFEYIEPYVVPKKSLTGESTERVDTRVLQVIYSFHRGTFPVYVGQQMDVFIDCGDKGNEGPKSKAAGV